ncbi:MAG: DUF1538 domain-containing protein [Nitrospina sp.]|nr:DUF1538 domain-containing protein [Nitrospina sp.]
MQQMIRHLGKKFWTSFMDVVPILVVIVFFQVLVIQKPFPNLAESLFGLLLVISGLFVFMLGLETALFPIGEKMAGQFAQKGSGAWVIFFGFALGFSTTIAEPALTVIAKKAGELAVQGHAIQADSLERFVFWLRITIAGSVGMAGAMGVFRIIKGWSLVHFIVAGYALIVVVTTAAPREIIGIAYDAGGITTSTITVPLITALGVGLASSIRGRNPVIDGFGIIALASLTPILFVLIFGIVVYGVGA